jgi:hypothetical protein
VEENTSKVYVGADPPLTAMAPGAGSALFVINLCASIAPVEASGRNLPGLENYRLYQVARVEDGRTRHRLRLGFFTSESHAESVLAVVRQQYPTAFTACLCDEDRRFVRGYLPQGAAAAAPAPKRPVALAAAPAPAKVSAPPAALSAKAPAPKPVATAPAKSTAAVPGPKAAPAPAPKPAVNAKPAASAQPAVSAKRAVSDIVEVSRTPEPPKRTAAPEIALDDLSWEPPALPASHDDTAATAKHPVLSAVHRTQPVMKAPAPAKAPPTPAKADAAASMRIKALDLTFSDPPAAAQKTAAASNEPFHVGKGVNIGDLSISLQAEAATQTHSEAKSAPRAAPTPPAKKPAAAAAVSAKPAPKATPVKQTAAPKAPTAMKTEHAAVKAAAAALHESRLQDLDSTQTIRALTSAELSDDAQEKWFAIQLAASEQPVNLDTMPHLDIFEAYRLYSVATAGSGKIVHSLRLGFFKEAVSADAVGGYLKTFFSTPTVLRISVAEHARFKDPPAVSKPRTEEARTAAKVVELSDARASRPVVPTVTMEVPTPRTDATGSFRVGDAFKPNATGSFAIGASGAHKVLTPTLKPAAKSAVATKRASSHKTGATGKHKVLNKKSLQEQLLDEAREVELSESGIRKLPKNGSLLSKLVGKLTK